MPEYPAGIVISDLTGPGGCVDAAGSGRLRLAVKDNIDVAGAVTSEGSRFVAEESTPAVHSAPVVQALVDAGAVVVSKVNMHEFAYGVTSDNPWFGAVPNPALPGRIPGGSSGGSAAVIAGGAADIALGTDTSGSIRMPAGCVGVVGLRPRAGLLDLSGVRPLCPSFDTVGPMAASVERLAWGWRALAGAALAACPSDGQATGTRAGIRVALHDPHASLPPEIRSVLTRSDAAIVGAQWGGVLGERSGEAYIDTVLNALWPAFRFEAARTHAARFPARAAEYGASVARKLAAAQSSTAADHEHSLRVLQGLRSELLKGWDDAGIDALVLPTLGCSVPRADDPEEQYEDALGRYAAVWSAVNLPALAIGNVQIVARTEQDVLQLGLRLEQSGLTPSPARD